MRNVQHKKEAFWFYRFLSNFYDDYVNPFFWTKKMRDRALALADLDQPDLQVVDVGSGTGFTTTGIVQHVDAANVTCIDQSPHQMAHAQKKDVLQACTFHLGDAEELPFPTDHFDRYVSAGSIEYWPEPQRGITEAYRVLKPGGVALMIGPLRPQNGFGRFLADTWMLFPEEAEYVRWFEQAGFTDLRKQYVAPSWVTNEPYGIALAGTKPTAGDSPLQLPPAKMEDVANSQTVGETAVSLLRLSVGTLAGGLFIPLALAAWVWQYIGRRLGLAPGDPADLDPLTPQQRRSLLLIAAGLLLWIIGSRKRTSAEDGVLRTE